MSDLYDEIKEDVEFRKALGREAQLRVQIAFDL
jgi:hypothetical protein